MRNFTDAFLELDDAGFLEEQEGTAAVRRVVRDGDRRAVLELVELRDLLGVDAHRLDVDARGVLELDFFVLVHEVLEVRLMLEEVRVELLVVEREVRLDIVVELDDLEGDAFLLEERLRGLEDFGVRHGGRADLQRFRAGRGGAGA